MLNYGLLFRHILIKKYKIGYVENNIMKISKTLQFIINKPKTLKKFEKNKVYEEYIKSILDNITTVNFLIVDIDINKSLSDAMDGNIRLVIEKK